ncbi:MAG: ABC transporter permease [Spirochaetales bacterium]|nr:ABC transporter permease [Spirochaetales bacterium]
MMQKRNLLYGIIIIIALWYLLSLLLDERLIPAPHTVLLLFGTLSIKGILPLHALFSLFRLVAALILALLPAIPLGIAIGINPRLDRILSPILYLLYPLPKIAFLPIFMVLFGLGNLSKIILLWAVVIFQLLIAVRDGVQSIPREYHIAADTLGLTKRRRFFKLYLPSALPGLFSALRISVGIGMAVLFFAENYATSYGLGYFIMNSWVMINYPMMFSGILTLGLLSYLVMIGLDHLENSLCPWKIS